MRPLRWQRTVGQANLDRRQSTACAARPRDWAESCRPARPDARLQFLPRAVAFPTEQRRRSSADQQFSGNSQHRPSRQARHIGLRPPPTIPAVFADEQTEVLRAGDHPLEIRRIDLQTANRKKRTAPFRSVSTCRRAARNDTTPIASPSAKSCPSPPIATPSTQEEYIGNGFAVKLVS